MAIKCYLEQIMKRNNSTELYDENGNVYHMQTKDEDCMIPFESDDYKTFWVSEKFAVQINQANNLVPFKVSLSNGNVATIIDIRVSKSIFPLDYLNNI